MHRFRPLINASKRRIAHVGYYPQLQSARNFQKIVVRSPLQVKLLDLTKSILQASLIFATGVVTVCGGLYVASLFALKDIPPIASSFTIADQLNTRVAIYYQDYIKDENIAEIALIKVLKSIAQGEGIKDLDPEGKKFQLLNLEQFKRHKDDWKTTYIDLVIRLALIKAELGDLTNAKKLNLYAINLPMNLGSKELRSQSLRLQAKISLIEEDKKPQDEAKTYKLSENYLLDSIRFNEMYYSDIIFSKEDEDSLIIDNEVSNINNETFNSLLDLGILYTKQEKYSRSLEIFLNLLQIAKDSQTKEDAKLKISVSQIPQLKNYIGEILYKKGLVTKSIEWCKDAAQSTRNLSHSDLGSAVVCKNALKNLSVLYGLTKDEELKNQATEEYEKLSLNFSDPKKFDILSLMF